ncbi:hypothetical protein [Haloparvum sp. PAK95]|uniref:hypothetical protein n=1 Tax=Haloparvum sp. PAK95 TaxID=3418962 RepID=UPI003D2EC23C
MTSRPRRIRRLVGTLLVISLCSMVVVAAPAVVTTVDLAIDRTSSESDSPGKLVPEGHTLNYDGNEVTSVTLYVNNTGGLDTGDFIVELLAKNGTTVASGSKNAVTLSSGGQEVTVTFDGTHSPTNFARIKIWMGSSL